MSTSRTRVLAYFLFTGLFAIFLLPPGAASRAKPAARQGTPQADLQWEARQGLHQGVAAFKNGQTKEAEQAFIRAKELDPHLIDARLYLARAYASQYIAGRSGEQNTLIARAAVEEFKGVLAQDPQNLSAMDGLGMMLFQMGSQPSNRDVYLEAKSCFHRHTQVRPDDPEPYYWIGVIDWTLAFLANRELRERFNQQVRGQDLGNADPLPWDLREQYAREYGPTIEEGIASTRHAIALRPDYDDAMAYLNLLYRRKADVATREDEREELINMADDLVDKVKEIKTQRAQPQP